MQIRKCVKEYSDELRAVRRDLHRIPELCFCEHRTAEYVRAYLEKLEADKLEAFAGTGVRAVFMANDAQRTVAVRADMDALPIPEQTGLPFASETPGAMHACGHDGHMAMALITAKIIASDRKRLKSNYVFLFQPSEEAHGGAAIMVSEGALKNPDAAQVYGLHLWPGLPGGMVGTRPGPMMAQMSDINIEITGQSAHGAAPQNGTDALVAAAQLITGVQSIVSRDIDPFSNAVITLGKITGGDARNIICGKVNIEGTMRSFSEGEAAYMKGRIREMLAGLEAAYGVKCSYTETMNFPPVINDKELTASVLEKLSPDEYRTVCPVMLSEDFSEFQKAAPGVYSFLGVGDGMKLHTGTFDFDEQWLQHGVEYYLRVTDYE